MAGWAIVSGCTALVHNYTGLVVVRFFLGIAEAPYYPGALYLLSLFYTRKEIATRIDTSERSTFSVCLSICSSVCHRRLSKNTKKQPALIVAAI